MKKKSLAFFSILVLISSLGQITSDMYLPSLPAISHAFSTSHDLVQLTLSFYMVGFCLSQFIYAPLSDGIGRRIPLLFGISLSILGGMVCLSAKTIEILIVGRVLQG